MATLTPLPQQSLPAPARGRDESVLHWGAAIGALVLASALVADVTAFYLGMTPELEGWLGEERAWDAADRFSAVTVLVAASAVVVTAVFVLADSSPPGVLSWVALAVAVLAWVSAVPFWWEVAGREAPLPVSGGTTPLVLLWMVLTGAAALAGGVWHRWLGVLTIVTGAWLFLFYWVPFLGMGALAAWAVIFAVAQVIGPHPAPGVGPVGTAAGATAVTIPGHGPSTTAEQGRWYRAPGTSIRLLSGVAPPVAVAITFLLGWQVVSQWPEAPSGDTSFAWMPAGAIMVCGVVGLVGLAALAVRTARAAAACSTLFWLSTVWLYPAAFVADGFPQSAKSVMVWLSVLSLLPTAIVWLWAAFGDVPTAAPTQQTPGDRSGDG